MKNLILLAFLTLCIGSIAVGQTAPALKVASDGKIGINNANPVGNLHLKGASGVTNLIVQREISSIDSNFMNLVSGTLGNGFFFKKNRRYVISPVNFNTDVYTDPPNTLYMYGPEWTHGGAGNVGIGVESPTEKLHVAGNIKASGTITPSDMRLKTILKSENKVGLSEVLQLNPVKFKYNGKGGTEKNGVHVGLIAQEVQKVLPDLVQEYTHIRYKEDNEGGVEKLAEEKYLEIRDSEIKFVLINAIKDQQAIIESQNKRLEELEAKFAELSAKLEAGTFKTSTSLIDTKTSSLLQNKPNPFNGSTTIAFNIAEGSKSAAMQIYDNLGRLIKSIQIFNKGQGELFIDKADIPSGVYTYMLVVDNKTIDAKQMVVSN